MNNGYLTISASKGLDKDEQDKKGKYIRKERYAGAMQRSFYVGDAVEQSDVKAKFEDGILKLCIPKKRCQGRRSPEQHRDRRLKFRGQQKLSPIT